MTKKLYSLTDEHRAQLKPWAEKWIANAMSTAEMTADEKQESHTAIIGLYAAAKLPEPKAIVFAKSPMGGAIAAGIAAGVWFLRENPQKHKSLFGRALSEKELMGAIAPAAALAVRGGMRFLEHLESRPAIPISAATDAATDDATDDAMDAATRDATRDATRAATDAATYAATDAATYAATDAATDDATRDATYAATRDATGAATGAATYDATRDATRAATDDAMDAATRDATGAATGAATYDATRDATRAATDAATDAATYAATRDATRAATDAATYAATDDATRAATRAATGAATRAATDDATRAATDDAQIGNDLVRFLVGCCVRSRWSMWNGGNMWSAWTSYLSFFRHVAKLNIDYSKWQHWEMLTTVGPRYVHSRFAIICDRPDTLSVDERNRPHGAAKASHRWRDGWEIHYWHGLRVPKRLIVSPESYSRAEILAISSTETRRALAERLGWNRYLDLLGGSIINSWTDVKTGLSYELYCIEETGEQIIRKQSPILKDNSQPWYAESVHRNLLTAQAARKWQAITPFMRDAESAAREANKNPELQYSVEA